MSDIKAKKVTSKLVSWFPFLAPFDTFPDLRWGALILAQTSLCEVHRTTSDRWKARDALDALDSQPVIRT